MNAADAKTVLLVKALEEEDRQGEILGRIERAQVSRQAAEEYRESLTKDDPAAAENFFRRRAESILALLAESAPIRQYQEKSATGFGRYRSLVCVVAILVMLGIGVALTPISDRQINILHFPLFGLIFWNLAVFLVLLIGAILSLMGIRDSLTNPLRMRLVALGEKFRKPHGDAATKTDTSVTTRALQSHTREWLRVGAPLHSSSLGIWFHLWAAAILGGMLAGMYLTGLGKEFLVTWESTFLTADVVHDLFTWLFAPLSWLGIALPTAAEIAEARAPGTQSAARWIFLLSAAGFVYVIIPRLLLAFVAGIRTAQLRRNFPLNWQGSPYFENLLNRPARHDDPGTTLVLPHSLKLEDRERQTLRLLFNDSFGSRMQVDFADPVQYGQEEEITRQLQDTAQTTVHDLVVLLFRLSATPEGEVQGQLITTVQQEARQGRLAQRALVLIDNSGFRERLGGDDNETAQKRIAQRKAAWENLCNSQSITPVFIDLDAEDPQVMGNIIEEVREATWLPQPA